MRKLVGIFILAIAGFTSNAHADVIFYGQCNYQGPSVTLEAGQYTASDLARVGIPENAINSIKVSGGFEVTVFADDDFKGRYGTLKSSDSCLEDDNFDKLISSLSIVAPKGAISNAGSYAFGTPNQNAAPAKRNDSVTVYTDCNFQGRSVALAPGMYTNADLNRMGIQNNSISALQVADGYQAEMYINDFHRGRSGTLSNDNPCLAADYNDEISSISVQRTADVEAGKPTPVAALFAHCNFRGGSVQLAPGRYNARALKAARVEENTVSSIKLLEGYQATIYTGTAFNQKKLVLTAEDDCLDNDGFNEQLSSLVIESVAQAMKNSNAVPALVTPSKPTVSNTAPTASLRTGLACVKQYVDNGSCTARRWSAIESRCQLSSISAMSDGYLKGHVEAGNCTPELWEELANRISNPRLR